MLVLLPIAVAAPTVEEVLALEISDTDLTPSLQSKISALSALEADLNARADAYGHAKAAFDLARANEDTAAAVLGVEPDMVLDADQLGAYRSIVLTQASVLCQRSQQLYQVSLEKEPANPVARERLLALTPGQKMSERDAQAQAKSWLVAHGPTEAELADQKRTDEREAEKLARKKARGEKDGEADEEYGMIGMIADQTPRGRPTEPISVESPIVTPVAPSPSGQQQLAIALSDPNNTACLNARDW